jgi:hypothetical protein
VRFPAVGYVAVLEDVWRHHQDRRVRRVVGSRRREAIALQDGWSASWIGLIFRVKCLLNAIIERNLAVTRTRSSSRCGSLRKTPAAHEQRGR